MNGGEEDECRDHRRSRDRELPNVERDATEILLLTPREQVQPADDDRSCGDADLREADRKEVRK